MVRLQVIQSVLVLFDVTFSVRDFLVQLFYLLVLRCLLLLQLLLNLLTLLLRLSVLRYELMKVHLVVFELLLGGDERLMSPLLALLKLFNLFLDVVICKFSQEHFFLLVDKLVGILGSLLLGELHTLAGHVHGLVDLVLLLGSEVPWLTFIFSSRRNVSVFHSV